MKKTGFILIALIALLLVSCELTGTAPSKGTLHVVAIGDNFTGRTDINPLLSCENDATAVCNVFDYWGNKAGMETDIRNCNGTYFNGFGAELLNVADTAKENDLTVIFVSTHGDNSFDFPIPYSVSNSDEAIFVLEYMDETEGLIVVYLPQSYLEDVADMIPGKVLIIADFCYSGALVHQDNFTYNNDNFTGSSPLKLFFGSSTATDSNKVFCLTASSYYQKAQSGFTLSVFTLYLLESLGLSGFNPDTGEVTISSSVPALKGKKIILSDIYRYIYESTARVQVPQMNTGASDLILFSL